MYNGIGLQTARGSGTNGYVQRNWASVRRTKDSVNYRTEEEIAKLDSASNKQPNQEILDHERKRKIEVKCTELEDKLEEQGLPKEEIAARVAAFRAKLSESSGDKDVQKDEYGRVVVRETHAVAEAQQEKNARLRDAFGISPRFVEGTSLDPERRAREEAQKYPLVRTPSHEKEQQRDTISKKKKKRSASPEVKKSKKKKSKKNKKEKQVKLQLTQDEKNILWRLIRRNESSKKKKKRSKSSDSESSSSSEGSDSESSVDDRQKKKKKDSHLYLKK
ncbi:serine/arginine repetitive matrix protein 2 isoform X11 [Pieris brassicae]|uniref:serine/arginine repetitive matrix protein 2 isoform X11 n=1 Tax=Pieris brassicae TaxID=7116 RepID=UPI001E660A41|nr:serine/arginine repetitive matrix protein 2 isoform X11 [Pieris brassicae]